PWFLAEIKDLVDTELEIEKKTLADYDAVSLRELKRKGFSDRRLAYLWKTHEKEVRARRHALGIRPVFKRVDTCAAEFATRTAYMYSSYDEEDESDVTDRRKIMVLGGVPIIGTSPDAIDRAEDRERFQQMLHELKLLQPPNRTARTAEEALAGAKAIGYPVVVRPSYVLGGRAMEIVHAETDLVRYMREAVKVSNDSPVLIDRFLNDAIEVDVDAVSDGKDVLIGGIMEHIEQAGVHSGDSACSLPPFSLSNALQDELRRQTVAMAKALDVVGLMNVQFAIQDERVYVLEVNPRASRTVPYVSKAIGVP